VISMANVNKLILIGRMTRDPECVTFNNGGKVAKFGIAVNNSKKDAAGQWVDEPMFLDCEAFNRGDYGKTADTAMTHLKRGHQVYLEGKLHLDAWDDKNGGGKRTKHKMVVDVIQLLEARESPPRQEPNAGPAPARESALPIKRQIPLSIPTTRHPPIEYDGNDIPF